MKVSIPIFAGFCRYFKALGSHHHLPLRSLLSKLQTGSLQPDMVKLGFTESGSSSAGLQKLC